MGVWHKVLFYLYAKAEFNSQESNFPYIKNYIYIKEINKLLDKGAISRCRYSKNQCLSSYFLIKKPNGQFRIILNLKKLNRFIKTHHFKLEDYREVLKLISKDCFMAKIDLKDAYFLLPIHKKFKKYLRFQFQNQLYEFNCLPFGLNVAPFIFTKLLRPVVKHLRHQGCRLVIYLDDILILGRNTEECQTFIVTWVYYKQRKERTETNSDNSVSWLYI